MQCCQADIVLFVTESPNSIFPAPLSGGLRHNYLSFIEDTAQTLGVMAPTGTIGIILPLLIARAGNTTWITFSITLIAFSLILFCVYRFSQSFASNGSLNVIKDPVTGNAYPGNVIPKSTFDPTGIGPTILNFFPQPNYFPAPGSPNFDKYNFQIINVAQHPIRNYVGRADVNITSKITG